MKADERIRRLLDQELSAEDEARLLAEAAEDPALSAKLEQALAMQEALQLLRDVEAPSASLAARSLDAALAAREEFSARRRWIAWLSPRWVRLRVSPGLLALPLVLGALVYFAGRHTAQTTIASSQRATTEDAPATDAVDTNAAGEPAQAEAVDTNDTEDAPVPVRFVLPASGARSVAVAGAFNGWNATSIVLADTAGDGVFVGTAYLPRGDWTYMFLVDGERWVSDPYAQNFRDDGFGGRNAVLRLN